MLRLSRASKDSGPGRAAASAPVTSFAAQRMTMTAANSAPAPRDASSKEDCKDEHADVPLLDAFSVILQEQVRRLELRLDCWGETLQQDFAARDDRPRAVAEPCLAAERRGNAERRGSSAGRSPAGLGEGRPPVDALASATSVVPLPAAGCDEGGNGAAAQGSGDEWDGNCAAARNCDVKVAAVSRHVTYTPSSETLRMRMKAVNDAVASSEVTTGQDPSYRTRVQKSTFDKKSTFDSASSQKSATSDKRHERTNMRGSSVFYASSRRTRQHLLFKRSAARQDSELFSALEVVSQKTRRVESLKKRYASQLAHGHPPAVGVQSFVFASAYTLVMNPLFDYIVSGLILVNAVLVGAQAQISSPSDEVLAFFAFGEAISTVAFTLELGIRMLAHGRTFFVESGYMWALLDIFLVVSGLVDLVLSIASEQESSSSSAGKMLKVARMARIMRVIRMLRIVGELKVMLTMMFNSLTSLVWIVIFLAIISYVFAVVLTNGVRDFLGSSDVAVDPSTAADLRKGYGSLARTMYTLIKAITGGVSWGEVTEPLLSVSAFYFMLLLFVLCFSMFSVLNIITGVFVDSAIEMAKSDRSILLEKETRAREVLSGHILKLLEAMDYDQNGTISGPEFLQALERKDVRLFMDALEIDHKDAKNLFRFLDKDSDGMVDLMEFVEGMQRLRGLAKSADLHMLDLEVRGLRKMLQRSLTVDVLPSENYHAMCSQARSSSTACGGQQSAARRLTEDCPAATGQATDKVDRLGRSLPEEQEEELPQQPKSSTLISL